MESIQTIYKKVLFQIHFENNSYFGIFTYHFLKYSYFQFDYRYKNKKEKNIDLSCNSIMNIYISSFLDHFIKTKNYQLYFISEITNKDSKSSIVLDEHIHVDCVIDEKNQIFNFLNTHITYNDFINVQNIIESEKIMWDFSDYTDSEISFLHTLTKKVKNKRSCHIEKEEEPKKYILNLSDSDSEVSNNSESEDESEDESDDESDDEYDYEKYESEYEYFSKEFRKKCQEDAYKKSDFWSYFKNQVKEDRNEYEYCRLREATQICRNYIYSENNIFKLRYLWIVDDIDIDNETYHKKTTEILNNDHLEVNITFSLVSKCKEYVHSGTITRSGCYDSRIRNYYDIDEMENVDEKKLKDLYNTLFQTFCPDYMYD